MFDELVILRTVILQCQCQCPLAGNTVITVIVIIHNIVSVVGNGIVIKVFLPLMQQGKASKMYAIKIFLFKRKRCKMF